ncbi:hypothetical protein [Streptomyces sp. NPDC058326]|uniref:hypothetical protein n=1 Tax=Streptomyces sp. NPDC058326 TaxID=3346447 RepID=UPI0036E5514C
MTVHSMLAADADVRDENLGRCADVRDENLGRCADVRDENLGRCADVLDENLGRLRDAGPEYGGTLTNHAPMVAEALIALRRPALVEDWITGYLPQLDEAPGPLEPIPATRWHTALGDLRRVTDWQAFFAGEIARDGWRPALHRWWPRLLPGVAAGATHGVIRTSHAVRGLAAGDTEERRAEFATALAYWAARYAPLPGGPTGAGRLPLARAIEGLPLHPGGVHPGLIRDRLDTVAGIDGFPAAVSALRSPGDAGAAMAELATTFAGVFLTRGRRWPTAFVHAVTAPVAAGSVLPLLPPAARRDTYDALWRLAAGLYAVHAPDAVTEPLPQGAPPAEDDLIDRAVANGDEHAIKLTEACLRAYRSTGDAVLLHAAEHGLTLLPEV